MIGRLAASLLALALTSGFAAAQSKVTVAIGGGSCLCYLPTVLARQLGEYEKAGLAVELVDLKGGSDALKPSPIMRPSTSRTGTIPANVPVTNASSAPYT